LLYCSMHCQWGRKPQNCPFPLGFRHPAGGGPRHGHSNMHKNLVKIARVVPEICWRTDKTDRHTDTQTYSLQYFATALSGEVIKLIGVNKIVTGERLNVLCCFVRCPVSFRFQKESSMLLGNA